MTPVYSYTGIFNPRFVNRGHIGVQPKNKPSQNEPFIIENEGISTIKGGETPMRGGLRVMSYEFLKAGHLLLYCKYPAKDNS